MADTPKIRIKGFTGAWEQRKLGELTAEFTEYTTLSSELPLLTSSRAGLMYQKEYRGNLTTDSKETLFSVVPLGACTYRHMSDDDIFHLNINALEKGLVSREYPVFTASGDNELNFIVQRLNSDSKFRAFCAEQKKGGTRTRLYYKTLCEFSIMVPKSVEQCKISRLLLDVDHLITLHQHKCDETKELKKYILQKMFPRNGKKIPEIRFAGFTDDWEQRKVGDIAERTYGGGTPKTSLEEYWEGDIPWIQSSNLSEHNLFCVNIQKYITETGLQKSAARLVPEKSIAVVSHVGVGKLVYLPFEYATSQDFISLSGLKSDPVFTCYALYKRLQEDLHIVQGSAIKGITKEDLLNKEIMLPSRQEQEMIGITLQNLDHLITLHQRKCDELKEVKKFMLQNMFPQKG